jgi:hypothetical protein
MDIGVFIPIGNNGWLISTTSPQYKPSFQLNKQIVVQGQIIRLKTHKRAMYGRARVELLRARLVPLL